MPRDSSEINASSYLRLLVIGAPKVGKTQTIISTAPGPVYVINSDDENSLKPAARVCNFQWGLSTGNGLDTFDSSYLEARKGVKEGRYQTVVWDTLSLYASRLQNFLFPTAGEKPGHGPQLWDLYRRHLLSCVDRLFSLKAHVIINSHYIKETVGEDKSELLPMVSGKAVREIPALCQDIIYLDAKGDSRYFSLSPKGITGVGCRSLPGIATLEADVSLLWEKMQAANSDMSH